MGASYEVYNRGHGYERNLLIILSFRGCGGSVCVCVWGGGGGGGGHEGETMFVNSTQKIPGN